MSSLGIELIAILLFSAIFGLFMGRFLCKGEEDKEREKRKRAIYALKTSQNELRTIKKKVEEQTILIGELEDNIAMREQKISSLNTKLLLANEERRHILEDLKELEKYKLKFDSLNNQFEIQAGVIKKLKESLENQELSERENKRRYQEMLDTKDNEYQKLKQEIESVESEYEEFKINYTLDTDRLEALEEENKKVYETLDTIIQERDNLLGRLRAISTVVEAIGAENGDENQQPLLENKKLG